MNDDKDRDITDGAAEDIIKLIKIGAKYIAFIYFAVIAIVVLCRFVFFNFRMFN